MKLVTRNLLYRKVGTSPTPPEPVVVVPLEITKIYTLDYLITTGQEAGVADIAYNVSWDYIGQQDYGWSKCIGNQVGNSKWFLGCYRGGNLNPGTQYGEAGDMTLNIFSKAMYEATVQRRCLWKYGNGYLDVYRTSGDWIEGQLVGSNSSGNWTWEGLQGYPILISNGFGDSVWPLPLMFYGLRIYNQQGGNLVAEYIATVKDGVPGILNTMTQYFVS